MPDTVTTPSARPRSDAGWARYPLVLGLIVLAGVVLRVLYVVRVGENPLNGDALEFHLASNLMADGRGFIEPFGTLQGIERPTADKPPLYTVVLAGLSVVGLRSPTEHQLLGVLTGALLILVVAAVARQVSGRPAGGLIAAAICAAYPPLIMADGSLRSESLFALLIGLAILAAVRYRRAPGWRPAAAGGVVVALAALTRGEALLLLGLFPLALLGGPQPAARRLRVRHLGLFFIVAAVVMTPWLVRSWVVFDEPVLISTNTGGLLAGANCDETYRDGPLLGQWTFSCLQPVKAKNEVRGSAILRDQGLRYARDHAGRLPVVIAARLGRTLVLFRPREQAAQQAFLEGSDLRVAQLAVPAFWLVALLALLGGLSRRIDPRELRVLLGPVVIALFVAVTAYGWPRLRAGAEPALIVLASVGVLVLVERFARRGGGGEPVSPPV